ncbi:MAG: hypothetical protein ACTHML_05385 [Ginsengibacter sp.]
MIEITINIPDESSELVKELVEKLGGSIDKQEKRNKEIVKPNNKVQKKATQSNKKIKKEEIDHTWLFGKWKDFDIGAKKLREKSW